MWPHALTRLPTRPRLHATTRPPTRPYNPQSTDPQALFSGDHLSGVEQDRTHWKLDGRLFIFTQANWYSVPEQLKSVQVRPRGRA